MSEKEYTDKIMLANKQVVEDLQKFNKKYIEYIRCNSKGTCPPDTLDNLSVNGNVLIKDIKYAQNITFPDNLDPEYVVLRSQSVFDTSYNTIMNNYTSLQETRADVDAKLRELYKLNGSHSTESQDLYDSVLYIGILFPILATTILYYTFTQL
jgi:hypothetical protein